VRIPKRAQRAGVVLIILMASLLAAISGGVLLTADARMTAAQSFEAWLGLIIGVGVVTSCAWSIKKWR